MFVSPFMSHVVVSDGDENIVFDEDEEDDEGFLFTGQGILSCNYLMHVEISLKPTYSTFDLC
jgi:hypothetical protein